MKLDNALHGMPALRKMSENDFMGTQRELYKDMQQEVDVKHNTDMIDSDDVLDVVDKMNEFMDPLRTNLKFELHEQLDERSEERRVGKESRDRWSADHEKKKKRRKIEDSREKA